MKKSFFLIGFIAFILQIAVAQKPTAKKKPVAPPQYENIEDLLRDNRIAVEMQGSDITEVSVKLTNTTNTTVRGVIQIGSYFVAGGNYQNMAVRTTRRFTLSPKVSLNLTIAAVCINAARPIPYGNDKFVGIEPASTELRRFLEKAQNEPYTVVQAGTWALTDGYSGSTVQAHLGYDNGSSAVSDQDIARARAILKALNIPNGL